MLFFKRYMYHAFVVCNKGKLNFYHLQEVRARNLYVSFTRHANIEHSVSICNVQRNLIFLKASDKD